MTDPYMPGPPPNLGPTMQQLAQPEAPKQRRKRRAPAEAPTRQPRRKKSQAAPSKPAKQARRRKSPVKATPPGASSPATTSLLGEWLGLTIELFKDMPDRFHPTVLDVLDTLYRPRA